MQGIRASGNNLRCRLNRKPAIKASTSKETNRKIIQSFAPFNPVCASLLRPFRLWFEQTVKDHPREYGIYRKIFIGDLTGKPSFFLSRWLFLRMLGFIYLIAFWSLWQQVDGLIGSNGILPAETYIKAIWDKLGVVGIWTYPTLCWIKADTVFLHFLCVAGIFLSGLLILGVLPVFSLAGLWVLYLSLSTVSQVFLGYQWDTCILEAGFLAIFLAPGQFLPRFSREHRPSGLMIWMFYWFIFRLMISAGLVKLTSGDITWRLLTALDYHYYTQPIPNPLAWYAHQFPDWFQKISVAVTLILELVIPLFILGPRRMRMIAFCGTNFLMICIILTGNYCFFNLLVIALCFLLLDDHTLKRFVPGMLFKIPILPKSPSIISRFVVIVLAIIVVPLSIIQMKPRVFRLDLTPAEMRVYQWTAPYRSVNSYGLFATMTTSRPEIIIEGSNDRKEWLPYEFKWKPGDLKRQPPQVAPHQPRIDWQMWFEALNYLRGQQPTDWFKRFLIGLLEGKTDIVSLLGSNPFPNAPPRYIRAMVYDYKFTDRISWEEKHEWWQREFKGIYLQPSELPRK